MTGIWVVGSQTINKICVYFDICVNSVMMVLYIIWHTMCRDYNVHPQPNKKKLTNILFNQYDDIEDDSETIERKIIP